MVPRALLLLALLVLAVSTQAFTVTPSPLATRSISSAAFDTALEGCRVNAKKEKIKRNRENMRKFKVGGRKGTSRRKLLKKALASKARQEEAEFISKCFITSSAPNSED
ncbi:expressed unknown protein [Seminavis robusta]|uniref:Uncharacterized protein n=1 Tax=Seminavis robusta TaxID=568900 RepID=A0A9N8DAH1_9STRA|nr:expressed unknown protein [Seminavis robusta]|eukprot:Sro11_g008850.1 n/a (109) ;mRNA; r:171922-172440